jgi:hypothetical protein
MFGDNQAVVKSSTLPEAKLHKRHTLLSFHRVREAVAAKMVIFIHIDGRINPADILSKHWGNRQVWENLQPLMFWSGDTMNTVFNRSEKESVSQEDNNNDKGGDKGISVHFDLKGRGVSGKPQERTLDSHTNDSCESSPFRSKTEGTVMGTDANAKPTPTYAKYTWIHPSVVGEVRIGDTKGMDTDVLDPWKDPGPLDPLKNVIDTKDLDTRSFGGLLQIEIVE